MSADLQPLDVGKLKFTNVAGEAITPVFTASATGAEDPSLAVRFSIRKEGNHYFISVIKKSNGPMIDDVEYFSAKQINNLFELHDMYPYMEHEFGPLVAIQANGFSLIFEQMISELQNELHLDPGHSASMLIAEARL